MPQGDAQVSAVEPATRAPIGEEPDGLTLAVARRAASLSDADVPADVIEIARQSLLDWFAVALGGSTQDAPRLLLELLAHEGAGEPGAGAAGAEAAGKAGAGCTVVGRPARLAALGAALVNGTAAHALDYDDVNIAFPVHASVAILPATLALAEKRGISMAELLTAYVAGYEALCTIAAALGAEHYRRGFHPTGTVGALGAAAACSRLLALDAQRTAVALGIAASDAAGLKSNFGTMTKPLHAGRASESGLLAALLAARGFTASPRAIEAERGLAAALAGPVGGLDDAPAAAPAGWHLRENLFKYHASCYYTHSAIEGIRELAATLGPSPTDHVDGVRVHVSELELGTCAIAEPRTALEVKFSLAHLTAMALLGRATSAIGDADADDRETIALRSRVMLVHDGRPGEPIGVEIALRDGTVLSARHDVNVPQRDLAAQRVRLTDKFRALAEPVLGGDGAELLLAALRDGHGDGLEVSALMALARP